VATTDSKNEDARLFSKGAKPRSIPSSRIALWAIDQRVVIVFDP
jgi:hypothetical protein